MIIFKGKLWGTLLALTVIGIFFATGSPLLGAPVPGGPGFVSVGSFEFKPVIPSLLFSYINNRLYTAAGGLFVAPVHLPHGATITQIILYYVDNGPADTNVLLYALPFDDPVTPKKIADITTSGANSVQRTLVFNTFPNGSVVDNQSNFYVLYMVLYGGENYQIAGVRIDYNYPTNLPLILK